MRRQISGQHVLFRVAALRPRLSIAATIFLATVGAAAGQVPSEYIGKWSNDPVRCEQANGEVDVMTVTTTGFDVYEVGCDLDRAVRAPGGTRFVGQCYKGGSPTSTGTVVMRRLAPDRIDVALLGFPWISEKPEVFRRCRSG
ncbi:hypothetical protein [Bradyrhizobium sp. LHD-71]|uniref:hypothetical protein n=1 Tax=Bradyrhizobium sp. LHD-71 TaxID=3072141 RepID=UPI0028100CF1|nr:hypothetical protein [Bradyrhizobium sp. LHD-71]MDQ8729167.1 hypothetical protein [Bradyrhizobium sp. LHD-71]